MKLFFAFIFSILFSSVSFGQGCPNGICLPLGGSDAVAQVAITKDNYLVTTYSPEASTSIYESMHVEEERANCRDCSWLSKTMGDLSCSKISHNIANGAPINFAYSCEMMVKLKD